MSFGGGEREKMNVGILGMGIIAIIVAGLFLLVGTQIFGNLDNSFACTDVNNTDGQKACDNVKDNTWLLLKIAPYGVLITGIFLIFGSVTGRF